MKILYHKCCELFCCCLEAEAAFIPICTVFHFLFRCAAVETWVTVCYQKYIGVQGERWLGWKISSARTLYLPNIFFTQISQSIWPTCFRATCAARSVRPARHSYACARRRFSVVKRLTMRSRYSLVMNSDRRFVVYPTAADCGGSRIFGGGQTAVEDETKGPKHWSQSQERGGVFQTIEYRAIPMSGGLGRGGFSSGRAAGPRPLEGFLAL